MEHQLLLTLSPADIEGDKKWVNLVNKNKLDKVRVEGKERVVKEESEFIKLGLGICADGFQEPSDVNIREEGKVIPVITINQLKELHQQVLIFNYIAAGVSVPSKLVIPIWKSVASSVFGSLSGGIHSNFSSYFRPQGINYKSLMDPEPGRCRRTDGKKWRCRKDVVPDTKYCERHMHRGRSRKHVETSGIALQFNTPTITYSNSNTPTSTCSKMTSQKNKSHNPADTSDKFPTFVPKNHQNKNPSLIGSKGLTSTGTAITTSSANGKSITTNAFVENNKSSRDNSDGLNGVDTGLDNIKDKSNNGDGTNGERVLDNTGLDNTGLATPELIIPSKSLVYGNTIGNNQVCQHRGVTAEEPQRCRRTDGKRWRCSKEAIPQQKYCGSHMNRGSKRYKSSSVAETVTATFASLVELKSDQTNLNTDLSISLPKCPQPAVINVDSSTSGSSSDATTVTDTDENTRTSLRRSIP